MRNFVITVNGTSYEVAVEEVEAGAAPVAAAPVAAAAPAEAAAAEEQTEFDVVLEGFGGCPEGRAQGRRAEGRRR